MTTTTIPTQAIQTGEHQAATLERPQRSSRNAIPAGAGSELDGQQNAPRMLSHAEVLELSKHRFAPVARALVFDWGIVLIALLAATAAASVWAWILAIVVVGTRQHALAVLGHDGMHRRLHRSRRANDWITSLCMLPVGIPPAGYAAFHRRHHRHLNTPLDPEQADALLPKGRLTARSIGLRALADLCGLGFPLLRRLQREIEPANRTERVLASIVPFITAILLGWMLGPLAGIAWIVALSTSFLAIFRVRAISEHVHAAGTWVFSTGPIGRFFLWPHATWCHDEHHRWPSIPFYNLRAARGCFEQRHVRTIGQVIRDIGTAQGWSVSR